MRAPTRCQARTTILGRDSGSASADSLRNATAHLGALGTLPPPFAPTMCQAGRATGASAPNDDSPGATQWGPHQVGGQQHARARGDESFHSGQRLAQPAKPYPEPQAPCAKHQGRTAGGWRTRCEASSTRAPWEIRAFMVGSASRSLRAQGRGFQGVWTRCSGVRWGTSHRPVGTGVYTGSAASQPSPRAGRPCPLRRSARRAGGWVVPFGFRTPLGLDRTSSWLRAIDATRRACSRGRSSGWLPSACSNRWRAQDPRHSVQGAGARAHLVSSVTSSAGERGTFRSHLQAQRASQRDPGIRLASSHGQSHGAGGSTVKSPVEVARSGSAGGSACTGLCWLCTTQARWGSLALPMPELAESCAHAASAGGAHRRSTVLPFSCSQVRSCTLSFSGAAVTMFCFMGALAGQPCAPAHRDSTCGQTSSMQPSLPRQAQGVRRAACPAAALLLGLVAPAVSAYTLSARSAHLRCARPRCAGARANLAVWPGDRRWAGWAVLGWARRKAEQNPTPASGQSFRVKCQAGG